MPPDPFGVPGAGSRRLSTGTVVRPDGSFDLEATEEALRDEDNRLAAGESLRDPKLPSHPLLPGPRYRPL
jgi:hypothetical protein